MTCWTGRGHARQQCWLYRWAAVTVLLVALSEPVGAKGRPGGPKQAPEKGTFFSDSNRKESRNDRQGSKNIMEAYAKAPAPVKMAAATTSFLGTVTYTHRSIQSIFRRGTRVILGAFALLAAALGVLLLDSLWVVLWPLSGAEYFFSGSNDGDRQACDALATTGPVRMLSALLTCMLVLFAPVVLVPPTQRHSSEEGLPKWCVRMLVRMYSVIFFAQMFNCWFVYDFVQRNIERTKAWKEDIANHMDKQKVLLATLGVDRDQMDEYRKNEVFFDDLIGVAALVLYAVVIWVTLIITYERVTKRSFKEDFPRHIMLLVFPCTRHLETFAGNLASFFGGGQEQMRDLVAKVIAADEAVRSAPQRLAGATRAVSIAFEQAREGVVKTVADAKQTVGDEPARDVAELMRTRLHKDAEARMTSALQWEDDDIKYFENLARLIVRGFMGTDDDEVTDEEIKRRGDDVLLPSGGFIQHLVELLNGAIDGICDAIGALGLHPSESLDAIGDRVCRVIDDLSVETAKNLDKVHERVAAVAEEVTNTKRVLNDTVGGDLEELGGLQGDCHLFAEEADLLVTSMATLSIRRHPCYAGFYKVLFISLNVLLSALTLMMYSVVFSFWGQWTSGAKVFSLGMLVIFGVMSGFTGVYFAEAVAGRLGHISARGAGMVARGLRGSQARARRARELGDEDVDLEDLADAEAGHAAEEAAPLLAAEAPRGPKAKPRGARDGASSAAAASSASGTAAAPGRKTGGGAAASGEDAGGYAVAGTVAAAAAATAAAVAIGDAVGQATATPPEDINARIRAKILAVEGRRFKRRALVLPAIYTAVLLVGAVLLASSAGRGPSVCQSFASTRRPRWR